MLVWCRAATQHAELSQEPGARLQDGEGGVRYLEFLQLVRLVEFGGQRLSQEGVQLLTTQYPCSRPLHHIPAGVEGQRGPGVRRQPSPVTRATRCSGPKETPATHAKKAYTQLFYLRWTPLHTQTRSPADKHVRLHSDQKRHTKCKRTANQPIGDFRHNFTL